MITLLHRSHLQDMNKSFNGLHYPQSIVQVVQILYPYPFIFRQAEKKKQK